MDIAVKLKAIRVKIEKATKLNKEFGDLVGIELFDYIQEQPTLQEETDKRVKYLYRLAEDPEFIRLQDHLYELIRKVLKEIDLTEVRYVQTQWRDTAWVNPLRERPKKRPDWVELPELHELFLEKKNYYRLGDSDALPHYFDGDISHSPGTGALRNQYEKFGKFLRLMQISEKLRAKWEKASFLKSLEEYSDARHTFNNQTQATPVKLHVAAFVEFFYFSVAIYSRKGYEDWYRNEYGSLYDNNSRFGYEIEEIKKAVLTVIDDLLEVLNKRVDPLLGIAEPIIVGPLAYTEDGRITYRGENIKMRPQIKTLCILFMQHHKDLTDYSIIKDNLIVADKRHKVDWETIQKYVSELHKLLKKEFKKKVIFLVPKEGYIFDTTRSS